LTHSAILIAAGATLAIALEAGAQDIYKQQLPDGTVVYADHRIKGAKLLYQMSIPDAHSQPIERPAPSRPNPEAAAVDKRLRERGSALERAHREVVDAERGLAEAQRQLEIGRELRPGEIQSSANGNTHVLSGYFDRIKKLEENVNNAQERLDRAYSERNQLR